MIDIVIPLYNSVKYSQKCVASIRKTLVGIPYRIHLLNNGSTDETAAWLETPRRTGRVKNFQYPKT